ncbi:hypothetical protein EHM76_01245 [bacterium]|nr:MAG: hypothetical protein EHM76_01245 [bacterium]
MKPATFPPEPKYPWADWFDGKVHALHRGVHFEVSYSAFRSAVHAAAGRQGLDVKTRLLGPLFLVWVEREQQVA